VRPATEREAAEVARLHVAGIKEGFLPTLGIPFLRRLYRRMVRSPGSFVLVATVDQRIAGFVAGTESVGWLYRSFLLRDGISAAVKAAPRLARSWRRAVETLTYGAGDGGHKDDLPAAELLSIAVAEGWRGRGVGRALVEAFQAEMGQRQIATAKVIVAAHNDQAVSLYRATGFHVVTQISVHGSTESLVLAWP
jgi:ribosomal protein S18 acetylase RimI-like enzyme